MATFQADRTLTEAKAVAPVAIADDHYETKREEKMRGGGVLYLYKVERQLDKHLCGNHNEEIHGGGGHNLANETCQLYGTVVLVCIPNDDEDR